MAPATRFAVLRIRGGSSASTDSGLGGGDCYGIVFCACGIVKACRALGDSLGPSTLSMGLPACIEVRYRRNRGFGGAWIAYAIR
jgi:hypothetical protein